MLSFPLGATVAVFGQSWLGGVICFLSGLLIDFDHLIEYVIHHGPKINNPKEVYQACAKFADPEENSKKKVYILFHAIEFAILLWIVFIFSQNIYLLAIALGYTGHMLLDVSQNVLKPSAYFISLRIKDDFNLMKLLKTK